MIQLAPAARTELSSKKKKKIQLFTNNFYQNSFPPSAVKFSVKYLFPGAKIQFAFGYCDNYLASHHLPLEVCITIILARIVMTVLRNWLMRSQLFQPLFIILMKAGLIIINKDRCSDVHGIDKDN